MEERSSSIAPRMVAAFLLGVLFASPLISAESFDFYYLVLMWPGAYCSQSTCCQPTTGPPENDFFIRGLWTYNDTGKAVTKCNGASFDVKQLSSLMDDLHSYWSNIRCPSNNGVRYWKSTWKTYGVCSGLNETAYFETALELRAKVDVLSLLNKKGILQSIWKLYDISDIESAIAEGIGATPVLRCSKDKFGYFQLYEIYICVDKDGKMIIECPVKPRFTCSRNVLFHPYHNEQLQDKSTANPIEMSISVE